MLNLQGAGLGQSWVNRFWLGILLALVFAQPMVGLCVEPSTPTTIHPTGSPGATATPTPTPRPTAGNETAPEVKIPELYELGFQTTAIWQQLFPFRSPYSGAHSLSGKGDSEVSETSTIYAGLQLTTGLDAYLNVERASGKGVSSALGLAGFTNGEVIRNPTLGSDPYLARYMLRYTVPLGNETGWVDGGENQIRRYRATHRLVITAGKMGTNDIFDTNSYTGSARTQFENWALLNAASYDYAADTRGYTQGVAVEWINPGWALRAGRYQMPEVANGDVLDPNLNRAFGDQIELELHPQLLGGDGQHGVLRLMAYRNSANMGNYQEALNQAAITGGVPNVTATEMPGTIKLGFGLNFEQPLADGGNTGVFARVGRSDGKSEDFAYTEADASFSLGGQLSGVHWNRPDDRIGLAYAQQEISESHREYLAAGGLGFLLGDGHLNYGHEQIVEGYYSCKLTHALWLSLDGQFIVNPGYNRDRGPTFVPSTRLHFEF